MRFALRGVSKHYGSGTVLDRIDLDFPAASVTAIVGSSGSGKSTVLRLLLGLELPDQGEVCVNDAPLPGDPLPLRRQIGYVIQEGGLFPHLSALQNLALLPDYLHWPRDRLEARVAALLALTDLPGSALTRYPSELSGGQRQRVALMRALILDPPALLLDEPLGALDPIVRHELQDQLRVIFQRIDKTVILVTHDIGEACFLAPRLAVLHKGRLLQTGTFGELRMQPRDPYITRLFEAQRALPESPP